MNDITRLLLAATIAGLAVLMAARADATELEATFGRDAVRISDAPCTDAVVAANEASEVYADMRAAWAIVDGKSFIGCWRMLPGGQVYLRYDDGDQGLIPKNAFQVRGS